MARGFFQQGSDGVFLRQDRSGESYSAARDVLNTGVGLTWLTLGIGRVLPCCEQDGKKPVCRAKVPFGNLSCRGFRVTKMLDCDLRPQSFYFWVCSIPGPPYRIWHAALSWNGYAAQVLYTSEAEGETGCVSGGCLLNHQPV